MTVASSGEDSRVRRNVAGHVGIMRDRAARSSLQPDPRMPGTLTLRASQLLVLAGLVACVARSDELTTSERSTIATEIDARVRDAYDLTKPGAEQRMLALYSDTGRIVSASGGRAIASRDTVTKGIHLFWQYVGANMKQPKWIWTHTYVDVLSRDAAVFTGTYRVPHQTPRGEPHEIAGAMTMVFSRRGPKWGVVQEHLSDVPAPPAAPMPMDSTMKMK
jgi:ketosteroid isomerase-like protein